MSAAAPGPQRQGPLTNLKVIEVCTTIAGPACARLLADFGADVIKIEPPEGDPVRQMGKHVGDVSLYAASLLRNKRSIALDLKTPPGRELAFELMAQADIVVENNRPGVMERLGLGYEALSARNPGRLPNYRCRGGGSCACLRFERACERRGTGSRVYC